MARLNLSGRVIHMSGRWGNELPLAGASIRILDIDRPGQGDDLIWEGFTDEEGRFHGQSKEWRDRQELRLPISGRIVRVPSVRDRLQLVVDIEQRGRHARLPMQFVGNGRRSPDLTVPWGPHRPLWLQLRPAATDEGPRQPGISAEKFRKLLARPTAKITTTRPGKRVRQHADAVRSKNRKAFEAVFEARSDLVKHILGSDALDGPDGEMLVIKTHDGLKRQVQLLQRDTFVVDMLLARRQLEQVEHQARVYGDLLERGLEFAHKQTGDAARRVQRELDKLPRPEIVVQTSIDNVDKMIVTAANVIGDLFDFHDQDVPSGYPGSCALEEGTGFGGDDGGTPSEQNPAGILANNWWPLKWYTTCVRDQGIRGTCTAFGIVAAVECMASVKYDRWTNLSEQDLYMHQKLYWWPFPSDWYGDGYTPAYSLLLQMLTGLYVFPFEENWDYNKSLQRTSDNGARVYTQSCVGYAGEGCSDTNHQAVVECYSVEQTVIKEVAGEVCSRVESTVESIPLFGGFLGEVVEEFVCEPTQEFIETIEEIEVCVYESPSVGTSGLRVRSVFVIWDPLSILDADLAVAKAYLAMRVPIVFCFLTVPSFSDDDNGYVSYVGDEEEPSGGHCVLITGYIRNDELPTDAPQGDGGGYFIIKNSWGANSGDAGYWYVPDDWVQQWGTNMVALTDIDD